MRAERNKTAFLNLSTISLYGFNNQITCKLSINKQ